MRRALAAVLAVAYLIAVAAVIPVYGGHPAWLPSSPEQIARWHSEGARVFADRARWIADQWTEADLDRWNHRFTLIDEPLIRPDADDPEIARALKRGWYTLAAALPPAPAVDTVLFADGKQRDLPLQSARTAYESIADGGTPDCKACISLNVTKVELTTEPVRTSRGPATVPVWAFTVRGLDEPVRWVAVDEDTEHAGPDIALLFIPRAFITGASDPLPPEGSRIDYMVGVRTCDTDVDPLVWETDLVVVLGAAYTPRYVDVCSMDRVSRPVSVTLSRPVGDRAIIDGFFGFTLEPWRTSAE